MFMNYHMKGGPVRRMVAGLMVQRLVGDEEVVGKECWRSCDGDCDFDKEMSLVWAREVLCWTPHLTFKTVITLLTNQLPSLNKPENLSNWAHAHSLQTISHSWKWGGFSQSQKTLRDCLVVFNFVGSNDVPLFCSPASNTDPTCNILCVSLMVYDCLGPRRLAGYAKLGVVNLRFGLRGSSMCGLWVF